MKKRRVVLVSLAAFILLAAWALFCGSWFR